MYTSPPAPCCLPCRYLVQSLLHSSPQRAVLSVTDTHSPSQAPAIVKFIYDSQAQQQQLQLLQAVAPR